MNVIIENNKYLNYCAFPFVCVKTNSKKDFNISLDDVIIESIIYDNKLFSDGVYKIHINQMPNMYNVFNKYTIIQIDTDNIWYIKFL